MSYVVMYKNEKNRDCLCDIETEMGGFCVNCTKEFAEQRVKELHKIGVTSAYVKPVEEKNCWWNDPKML